MDKKSVSKILQVITIEGGMRNYHPILVPSNLTNGELMKFVRDILKEAEIIHEKDTVQFAGEDGEPSEKSNLQESVTVVQKLTPN